MAESREISKYFGLIFFIGIFLTLFFYMLGLNMLYKIFRIVFGTLFILIIPGYIATYVFFEKINLLKRFALSPLLSIFILIPILIFSNLVLRTEINFINIYFQITFLCVSLLLIIWLKQKNREIKSGKPFPFLKLYIILFLLSFALFYYYYKPQDPFKGFYNITMVVYQFYSEKNISQNLTNVIIQNPKVINFDNKIVFLGYNLNNTDLKQGESFHIIYFWKSLNKTNINYTVFVHIIDKMGNISLQQDHSPPIPTSQWNIGDIIMEEYDVDVPLDINEGKYDLRIGLYDFVSKEKLTIIEESFGVSDSKTIGQINIIQ